MAELVVYAISYAASAASGLYISQAVAIAITVASFVAAGEYQRRKAVRKYNAGLEDRLVMMATTDGPRSRVYGRARNVDGVLFKATRGTNSEFYTLVVALAGHEIDAVETVYFNDQAVTLDGSGYVTTAPWYTGNKTTSQVTVALNGSGGGSYDCGASYVAGSAYVVAPPAAGDMESTVSTSEAGSVVTITGGPASTNVTLVYQTTANASKARVRSYLGTAAQDLSTVLQPLFPSLITSGVHKFAGIACLIVDLEFDPDAFPTGIPSISAVIRGAKILDPRTSTTAWTENPALIARDWALHANGGGCDSADLVAESFTDAANACDVSTSFTTPSGTVSLPLYTCGIVCKLDGDPWAAFQEMVEAMAGKAGWAGGQLRVVAGVYRASVATITEDWLSGAGDIQVLPEPPVGEAVNIYRATIADKDQKYVVVPAPELRASTYVTADGEDLPREITLGGVTDTTHAQHVCGVLMRDARNGLTVVLPCNLRAYQVELFDVVSVTLSRFGWSSKLFEVVDWQFSLSGGVVLTLKETAAAIYSVDSSFAELDLTPNTQLPDPSDVAVIGTLTVTSGTAALTDGSMLTRTKVAWTAPADQSIISGGRIEVQWTEASTSLPAGDWDGVTESGRATSVTINGLRAGKAYIFRARGISALGVRGQWSRLTGHVVSEALFSGDVGGGNLVSNGSFEQRETSYRPSAFSVYNGAAISVTQLDATGRTGGKAFGLKANASTSSTFGLSTSTATTESSVTGGVRGGWVAGRTYVMSFWAKKVNGSGMAYMGMGWNTSPTTLVLACPALSTSWQRYVFRLTWGGSVEANGALFLTVSANSNGTFGAPSVVANDEIHIDDLQVEEGDVATTWKPSSSDLIGFGNLLTGSNVGTYVDAGAVTDVTVATASGPVDTYNATSGSPVTVLTISVGSYSVATDVTIIAAASVTWTVDGDFVGPPTPWQESLKAQIGNATDGWTEILFGDQQFDGSTTVNASVQFTLPASTSRTYTLRCTGATASILPAGNEGSTDWSNVSLVAIALKR